MSAYNGPPGQEPRFEQAAAWILQAEGGYSHDVADPGGETRWGISKAAYPQVEMASLSWEEAKAIYRRDYWSVTRCDEIQAPIALALFDAAVNQGVKPAVQMLQTALRLQPDGIVGPDTIHAANAEPFTTTLPNYLSWRAVRYMQSRGSDRFLRGWLRRLFRLELECFLVAHDNIAARALP